MIYKLVHACPASAPGGGGGGGGGRSTFPWEKIVQAAFCAVTTTNSFVSSKAVVV